MSIHISAIITIVTFWLHLENLVIISLRRVMGNDKPEKGLRGFSAVFRKCYLNYTGELTITN